MTRPTSCDVGYINGVVFYDWCGGAAGRLKPGLKT